MRPPNVLARAAVRPRVRLRRVTVKKFSVLGSQFSVGLLSRVRSVLGRLLRSFATACAFRLQEHNPIRRGVTIGFQLRPATREHCLEISGTLVGSTWPDLRLFCSESNDNSFP